MVNSRGPDLCSVYGAIIGIDNNVALEYNYIHRTSNYGKL